MADTNTNIPITVTVNGDFYQVDVPPYLTLLELFRDRLDLTGSKRCCGEGECGACTVLMDGHAVNSCLILAAEVNGSEFTTVEGLSASPTGSALQQAFLDQGSVQCGFCTPGMLMAAEYVLMNNSSPSPEEVREGLSGNLCRCTGYARIVDAVRGVAGK